MSGMLKDEVTPPKYGIVSTGIIIPPADYSFLQLQNITDAVNEEARLPKGSGSQNLKRDTNSRWITESLKLNNNRLDNIDDIVEVTRKLISDSFSLTWIDLSCNSLTKISDKLLSFANLKLLNLHGNKITEITEVDKLNTLPNLLKLSLHGNPIENEKNYFYYVLGRIPKLINLDFTGISPGDRKTAQTFQTMIFKSGNRRKAKNRN